MSTETKKCPECLTEIPKQASRCSHCGAKQKVHVDAAASAIIIGIVVVGIGLTVYLNSGYEPAPQPASQARATAPVDVSTIQSELEEWAEGRWSDVQVAEDNGNVTVRVAVSNEVPANETALNNYCNIINDALSKRATDHSRNVSIYQYGKVVRSCLPRKY